MKKFIKNFFLFIIIILSAAAAYMGFIRIDYGEAAILSSVSEGLLEKELDHGYHWSYRSVIPKNIKIIKYSSFPRNIEISIERELPGAYFLYNKENFSVKFDLRIKYRIRSGNGVRAYRYFDYDFENIGKYIGRSAGAFTEKQISDILKNDLFALRADILLLDLEIKKYLNERFSDSGVECDTVEIYNIIIPQIEEYRSLIRNNKNFTELFQKKRLNELKIESEKKFRRYYNYRNNYRDRPQVTKILVQQQLGTLVAPECH